MPRYTNRHGVPDPLFRLLGRESYSRGDSVKSVSQLINAPRADILGRKHDADVEVDISDRIWALFGTAVHKLIEDGAAHSPEDIAEERLFLEVLGWKISGGIDRQLMDDGTVSLWDWKVCSVWSVKSEKIEWVRQLNFYAHLAEKAKGVQVTSLNIGALIRDWNRREAQRDPNYPQSPIHVVSIPMWTPAEREVYVHDRVRLHQKAEMEAEIGGDLPPCTAEEMWTRDEAWAVWKGENKRPTRVFDNMEEAVDFSYELGDKARVEHRPGTRLKCAEFCPASKWCDQNKRLTAQGL